MLCLQLSEKVRLDHRVQTIQLPAEIYLQENHVVMWLDGEKLKLMGSLLMSEGGGRVIDRHVCEEQWPGLPANVTCAGGYKTAKGFCQVCFLCFQWKLVLLTNI